MYRDFNVGAVVVTVADGRFHYCVPLKLPRSPLTLLPLHFQILYSAVKVTAGAVAVAAVTAFILL